MEDTTLKIAIAGFLHDIGKFADKDSFNISEQFLINNADLYQPHFKEIYTHRHALYTAAFIDHIEKLLPAKFNQANWGLEDSFINLAASHHIPKTPMQWIIAIADRVSSGWDRDEFDQEYNRAVAWKNYKQTRLLPIFEQLRHENIGMPLIADNYDYSYPLKEISPLNIFPGKKEQICPENNQEAISEYKKLFEDFIFELEHLLHKEENLALWFEHFDNLMMIYTSAIPAARAGNVIPDVSLYDHSKITAALAVAIYLYHRQSGTMLIDEIKDYTNKKFLLINGDFYGIQKFIFSDSGEAGKNRAKILRGRSFVVSVFSELAADMLCREIGIPTASLLINAAGKFTIIAPNTEKTLNTVDAVEKEINEWLFKISFGENFIGMTCMEASAEDFIGGKFVKIWDNLNEKIEFRKFRKFDIDKYGGTFQGYLDGFYNDLAHPLCPFCGKRPSAPELENSKYAGEAISICKICRDHIFMGENIVKKARMAITTHDADIKGSLKLVEPIFGKYQVAFTKGGLNMLAKSGQLLKYWDISIHPEGIVSKDITSKFINGYVPLYRDEDFSDERFLASGKSEKKKEEIIDRMQKDDLKSFGHIASKAMNPKENGDGFCGIDALGILKADVDKMGLLMSCGLAERRFTLSRLATLSRQLNFFFAVYIPYLLEKQPEFNDIYTVFSGGDDLFLIGPWNRIIELTEYLENSFDNYVCHNNKIHFSAGISIHKPHTPLNKLSDSAENAIEKSKDGGRNRLTLFSETVEWDLFKKLREIKKHLNDWLEDDLLNKAMIYRLNDFIQMSEMEKKLKNDRKEIYLEDMECFKWRALFSYTTSRNVGRGLKGEKREKLFREFSKAAAWLDDYGSKLKIALWDIIYNHR